MSHDLPGQEVAEAHGYVLHSYQSNKSSANYLKDGICLRAFANGEFEFTCVIGIVSCTTHTWTKPENGRFEYFERAIREVMYAGTMCRIHHIPIVPDDIRQEENP